MRAFDVVAAVLVLIGALNWGLFGIARLDLVQAVLGGTLLASAVYVAVGLSGMYLAVRSPAYLGHGRPARA